LIYKKIKPHIFIIFFLLGCNSLSKDSQLLTEIFHTMKNDFPTIVADPDLYQIQILYTQVDRNIDQSPQFTTHKFNIDPKRYFYPASTVKFPAAVLALDKLSRYESLGITINSKLAIGTGFTGMLPMTEDSSSFDGNASISQFIKKMFVVSNDDAFNRVYEFLGQDHLNLRMWELGYPEVRFRQRLSMPLTEEENRHTNPFYFFDDSDRILLNQPMHRSDLYLPVNSIENLIGKAFMEDGNKIDGPMDFSVKNFFKLSDQQRLLRQVMFPEIADQGNQLYLSEDDYKFLFEWMAKIPRESKHPSYPDYSLYPDSYCKFFMYGDSNAHIPDHIKIFNKVGWAYGFLTDNAYIIDTQNGVEFFLSAVIYVNKNGVLNDDEYEFNELGLPFLASLGNKIYEYELGRFKSNQPDFSRFITQ